MRKSLITLGLTALLVWPSVVSAQAQGPRSGRQQGQRSERRIRPKMELTRLWRGIGKLEKSKTPITTQQAKKLVAIVRPWSNNPQMSDAQAQNLHTQISVILTAQQKASLQNMAAQRRGEMRGRRGEREQRYQRTNGAGRSEQRGRRNSFDPKRMEQMRNFLQSINPFYAPTGYKEFKSLPDRMQKGLVRRYQGSRAILVALSQKAR